MRRRFGDRRKHRRYDVEGYLAATLASTQTWRIANIGRRGALVETLTPLPSHSVYSARLVLGGEESDVRIGVRHVRLLEGQPTRYLLGIEFLDLPPSVAARIGELLRQSEANPEEPDLET